MLESVLFSVLKGGVCFVALRTMKVTFPTSSPILFLFAVANIAIGYWISLVYVQYLELQTMNPFVTTIHNSLILCWSGNRFGRLIYETLALGTPFAVYGL